MLVLPVSSLSAHNEDPIKLGKNHLKDPIKLFLHILREWEKRFDHVRWFWNRGKKSLLKKLDGESGNSVSNPGFHGLSLCYPECVTVSVFISTCI